MDAMKDYTVVLWSPSQKAFHSETVAEMLRCNLRVYHNQSMTDYLPIGLFNTQEEATNFIRSLINKSDTK